MINYKQIFYLISALWIMSALVFATTTISDTSSSFTGNLAVDTNTLYVDSVNDRVGIGTTSPLSKLHITPIYAYNQSTIESGIFILSPTSSGLNNFGSSLIFGELGGASSPTRGTSITVKQTGSDSNQVGLSFSVHSSTSGSDPRVETIIIKHSGVLFNQPLTTAPATCVIGDTYVDSSGAYCFCGVVNTWQNLATTGTCA